MTIIFFGLILILRFLSFDLLYLFTDFLFPAEESLTGMPNIFMLNFHSSFVPLTVTLKKTGNVTANTLRSESAIMATGRNRIPTMNRMIDMPMIMNTMNKYFDVKIKLRSKLQKKE